MDIFINKHIPNSVYLILYIYFCGACLTLINIKYMKNSYFCKWSPTEVYRISSTKHGFLVEFVMKDNSILYRYVRPYPVLLRDRLSLGWISEFNYKLFYTAAFDVYMLKSHQVIRPKPVKYYVNCVGFMFKMCLLYGFRRK